MTDSPQPGAELPGALFDAMPQLGWAAGPDGRVERCNARWCAYVGATGEETAGPDWTSIVRSTERPRVTECWRRCLATGEPLDMEVELRRCDGEMRWFLTRVEPMRASGGEVVRWIGTHTDVHDSTLARAALRRAHEAEKRRHERLRRLFEQAPLPIALHEGPEHRYVLANPCARELVGGRDLEGKPLLEAHPELVGQPIVGVLDEVLRTGRGIEQAEAHPVWLQSPEGEPEERWFRASWAPVRAPSGEVEGVLAVGVDLTEQMRLRRELVASEARAVSANQAKDEFLAMLGHELRNPLAPIRTALELMDLHLGEHELRQERDVVERQVGHLVRMVDDLLDVARIARGKLVLKREPLDLARVVGEAVETASPLFESKGHRLTVDIPSGVFVVDGDPDRLSQVMANLLINAAKYTRPGGEVHVSAETKGGAAEVCVRDDGRGLPPELLARLFYPFEQSPQSIARSNGGLGLGLAIALNIVEQHGGTLVAESDGEGQGSTFTVRLPLIDASTLREHERALRAQRRSAQEMATVRRIGRILLVDDNEDAAQLLAARLTKRGYEVTVAYDGARAMEVVAGFQPDVCVLDIGLPVMDGYELAHRLRAELDPTPRFIALTGYGQRADKERAREAGFDRHFTKPVGFQDLVDAIDEEG